MEKKLGAEEERNESPGFRHHFRPKIFISFSSSDVPPSCLLSLVSVTFLLLQCLSGWGQISSFLFNSVPVTLVAVAIYHNTVQC